MQPALIGTYFLQDTATLKAHTAYRWYASRGHTPAWLLTGVTNHGYEHGYIHALPWQVALGPSFRGVR